MAIEISSNTTLNVAEDRSVGSAMWNGAKGRCPSCGKGPLYTSYLKVADTCSNCSEELHHQRADDAPPYFTILIVCHIIGAGILAVEDTWAPPSWVHAAIWVPLILVMSLSLLPPIKGTLIGIQWANRMHGFAGKDEDAEMADQTA